MPAAGAFICALLKAHVMRLNHTVPHPVSLRDEGSITLCDTGFY